MLDPDHLFRFRWDLRRTNGGYTRAVVHAETPEWLPYLDALIAEGFATDTAAGRIVQAPPPKARQYTDEAQASIREAMKLILAALQDEGEVPSTDWARRGRTLGIDFEHVKLAYQWLVADGLVTTVEKRTRPGRPLFWLPKPEPKPVPAEPKPEPKPVPVNPEPKPEPPAAPAPPGLLPGWPAAAEPEPELEPEPAAVPARVTTRTLAATIVPTETATVAGDGTEESQLLRRLVFAAEVSAGLTSAPTRVRTPLGVNPLLDTQLRLAVVLCGAGRPMMASEISTYHLTPEQKVFLAAALEDGCKRGGFTATGGRGRSGRGRLYSLADVTAFDGVSWESLHAAVEAQREARSRRKQGSGTAATA